MLHTFVIELDSLFYSAFQPGIPKLLIDFFNCTHIKIQSLGCKVMTFQKYILCIHHYNIIHSIFSTLKNKTKTKPKNTMLSPSTSPHTLFEPLANTVWFPECHITEIILHAASSDWHFSFNNMDLRFIYVVWIIS